MTRYDYFNLAVTCFCFFYCTWRIADLSGNVYWISKTIRDISGLILDMANVDVGTKTKGEKE